MVASGTKYSWLLVEDDLRPACVSVDGKPCVLYAGEAAGCGLVVGAAVGGVELADAAILSEACAVLQRVGDFDGGVVERLLEEWAEGDAGSMILDATARVVGTRDDVTGDGFLVDYIVDYAEPTGECADVSVSVCLLMCVSVTSPHLM
jgi:6-phosphogluconate dehydrogenase